MHFLSTFYKTPRGRMLIFIGISFMIGYGVSYYSQYYSGGVYSSFTPIRQIDTATPLIRPLLAYNTPEMSMSSPLRDSIKRIINSQINTNKITTASVYYRDLNTGHWFGINQDETYIPASLFKVPLMITYLKFAHNNNKNILSKQIYNSLTEDQNINQTIKPSRSIVEGEVYTVEQLLRFMIEYSDNNATVLLFNHVDKDTLKQVFSDLDIEVPSGTGTNDFLSVENYSFLFRILYNSSYLDRDMSEKALELLSKIDFSEGIRKPIPSTVPVATKFGEYFLINGAKVTEHQLHDCGIVYHPKYPYILCIMTKGPSLDALEKTIQSISQTTYQTINTLK